jgi:DNA-binding transcriptional ArsR family regulator
MRFDPAAELFDQVDPAADPTRRQIIEMPAKNPLNLNSIADNFNVSRQAVSVHVRILTGSMEKGFGGAFDKLSVYLKRRSSLQPVPLKIEEELEKIRLCRDT